MDGPDDAPTVVPIDAEIDLHSFAPADIRSVVDEYVHAAAAAGFQRVRIVHGRGRGVQRAVVRSALDAHPRVLECWDDPSSRLGATVARLETSGR